MKYKPVFTSDPLFNVIAVRVYESYSNACILYIDEVVNDDLQAKYERRRTIMANKRGVIVQQQLFHGTHEANIDTIATKGFDPTLNKRAVFGYGVYFAKNAACVRVLLFRCTRVTNRFLTQVLQGLHVRL
jgi:hypothetical protein